MSTENLHTNTPSATASAPNGKEVRDGAGPKVMLSSEPERNALVHTRAMQIHLVVAVCVTCGRKFAVEVWGSKAYAKQVLMDCVDDGPFPAHLRVVRGGNAET